MFWVVKTFCKWVGGLFNKLRQGAFNEDTLDKIQAWIVFVGVPLMLIGVSVLLMMVGEWFSEAKRRDEIRAERTREAVEQIVDEIRQPEMDGEGNIDTRQETFDRIRQLCYIHEGCEL